MTVFGYIRVSTDKQDFENQKLALLKYAQHHQLIIDHFIEVEVSSRKSKKARRIEELLERLSPKDILLATELSRLGRNMLEILGIIQELSEQEINMIFTEQPELATSGPHGKLLLAIYGYFAETEREFISMRTKQGLAAARAKGKLLGRPKGSKNKRPRVLDPYDKQIEEYLELGLNLGSIMKIINNQLDQAVSYQTFKYHVDNNSELSLLREKKKITAQG